MIGTAASPVLVLGSTASGAELLALSIGQHPELRRLPDARALILAARAQAPHLPEAVAGVVRDVFGDLMAPSIRRLIACGPDVIEERGALHAAFPDAAVLHVVRDVGEAVQDLVRPMDHWNGPGYRRSQQSAHDAIRHWGDSVRGGLEAEAQWGAGAVLRIRFCDLLGDPETTLVRCFGHIGEAGAIEALRPYRPNRSDDQSGRAALPVIERRMRVPDALQAVSDDLLAGGSPDPVRVNDAVAEAMGAFTVQHL